MKTIAEINAERKANPLVERESPLLGKFKVRKLAAGDVFGFNEEEHFTAQLVLASAMKLDGTPMYASVKEVKALDWGVYKALSAECNLVNSLDLEAAKKN